MLHHCFAAVIFVSAEVACLKRPPILSHVSHAHLALELISEIFPADYEEANLPLLGSEIILPLQQNSGQSAAIAAGFRHAAGNVIAALAGELQNDPVDIPLGRHFLDAEESVIQIVKEFHEPN